MLRKNIRVVLLRQKKRFLPQNKKWPIEQKFMVLLISLILSKLSLQLVWQEITLLLDVHFLLIINIIPLGIPSLPQDAQLQGIQTVV